MTTKQEQLKAAEAEVERLKAEIEAEQSGMPAVGRVVFLAGANGGIFKEAWSGNQYHINLWNQNRIFLTDEAAILFSDWERAVTRINRAIRAGERGGFTPHLFKDGWIPVAESNALFTTGSDDSINAIIQSHAADFEAVRKYMAFRDGGAA